MLSPMKTYVKTARHFHEQRKIRKDKYVYGKRKKRATA